MGRTFSLLLLVTALLISAAAGAVYWISSTKMANTREYAANEVAQAIALSVSEQLHLLNTSLDKIAQEPTVIEAITRGNPAQLAAVAHNIQANFPGAMKIRLVLPDVNAIDETTVPHMGYADLDMVKETLAANQAPMVQGDIGPNRHLAMTSQIRKDNQVVGVILASLNFDFISKTVKAIGVENHYFELKQEKLVLGTTGSGLSEGQFNTGQIKVPRTSWLITYQYPADANLGELAMLFSILLITTALTAGAFFLAHLHLNKMLKNDLSSVLKAFKDIISNKSMGSYPVSLSQMNILISSFIRLNRALDDNINVIQVGEPEDEDGLEKNGFFETPENFGFSEVPPHHDLLEEELFSEPELTERLVNFEQPADKSNVPPIFNKPEPAAEFPELMADPIINAPKKDALSEVFKAYDIRGIVGKSLTMNMVYDIGRAFGTEALKHNSQTIVLGRDGRLSSPTVADELAKGIASTGCGIIDLGMVPTPVVYFAAQHIEGKSGIMVTGSHNPPEYNGFKMVVDGETLAESRIQSLKSCINSRSYATGEMGLIEKNAKLANEYIGTIAEDVRIARPMLVVLDCGNGVGGKLGPLLLKTLGCEVLELHCDIDGSFPNHHPDPSKPENMAELSATVKHYKADLGIAFDGDADRLGVVDSNGKIIWPDRQMMLFAKNILSTKPGAEIIFDVKCSKHLPEQIKKYGGRPIMWKTGHSLMKAKIKETNAKLAGEMTGHIFFNDRWFGFDDALYAAARLIEILSNESGTSAQVFASFPDSVNTPEINVEITDRDPGKFVEQLRAAADFADGKLIEIDGLRVEFDNGWGLVRASNTTPSLTLRFEADTVDALNSIQQRFRQLINKINPDLDLPF